MPPGRRPNPEREARSILERLNIRGLPVPVGRIARSLGAVLRYSPLDEELSGMIYVKSGQPIIGVNALHHPNRQRFTIAHETGHLVMHHDLMTERVHVDKGFPVELRALKRDVVSALGTEIVEVEANRFAAALLVPQALIEEELASRRFDIDDEEPIQELARRFRVSKQMLEYRIRNLPNR